MANSFKILLRKFCLESTFLGLKYFYLYPDYVSRCFWSISMLIITFLACSLVWLLYHRFDEMPTRITIENQYELVNNIPYPSIALCSPNQLTISAMHHFNRTLVDGNRTVFEEKYITQLLAFQELFGDLDKGSLIQLQSLIEMNRYHALDMITYMPQQCHNFLKLCFLDGKLYPNCRDLFYPILTKRGFCCIFNSIYELKNHKRNERRTNFTLRKAKKSGLNEGLTVVSDYQPDDAIDGTIINAGAMRIMVMNWDEFPADDESTLLRPFSESFHMLEPTYTYCSDDVAALPSNSRECYFENEMSLRYFNKYHNSDCDLLCHVSDVEKQCKCTMMYIPNVRMSRACNISNLECINKVRMQSSEEWKSNDCECPRDCVSYRYRSNMVIGNVDGFENQMQNIYGDIQFNKSSSIMHFYIPKDVYVIQKQETVMSLISLFSNLGGVFGLCLGCSVISVFEILFFIQLIIKNQLEANRKLKNKINNANPRKRQPFYE